MIFVKHLQIVKGVWLLTGKVYHIPNFLSEGMAILNKTTNLQRQGHINKKLVQIVAFFSRWVFNIQKKKKKKINVCIFKVITKTCLYNFDPLKPHFYIVNLGFTGVYIIFLISSQKHRLWVLLEPPRRGGSNEYPQYMFWAEIWKISEFFIRNFSFYWW